MISQCPPGDPAKSLELQRDTASGSLCHHSLGNRHREKNKEAKSQLDSSERKSSLFKKKKKNRSFSERLEHRGWMCTWARQELGGRAGSGCCPVTST